MRARAFVPGHISTFFRPAGSPRGAPIRRGSLGSGFCLEQGVLAAAAAAGPPVAVRDVRGTGRLRVEVQDNGSPVRAARTTHATLDELLSRAPPSALVPEHLVLSNRYALPLGAGFGVSGACALGAALSANEAMGLDLPRSACVAAAHCGEVRALTGLGDVGAQALGGFEVRTREGPPPLGAIRRLPCRAREVLLVSFGARPTRAFLEDPRGKARLSRVGGRCLEALLEAPTPERSVALGLEFAKALDLVSRQASAALARLRPGALASVAMLGNSVFALESGVSEAQARHLFPRAFVAVTRIALGGARLL